MTDPNPPITLIQSMSCPFAIVINKAVEMNAVKLNADNMPAINAPQYPLIGIMLASFSSCVENIKKVRVIIPTKTTSLGYLNLFFFATIKLIRIQIKKEGKVVFLCGKEENIEV